MLGVLDQEMESFVERWMGSTPDVIAAVRSPSSSHPTF